MTILERIKKNLAELEAENQDRSETIEEILQRIEYEEDLMNRKMVYDTNLEEYN